MYRTIQSFHLEFVSLIESAGGFKNTAQLFVNTNKLV